MMLVMRAEDSDHEEHEDDDRDQPENLEDTIRNIAREIGRSAERMTGVDLDEIAGSLGVDADRAKRWFESAGSWMRAQAENRGFDPAAGHPGSDRQQPGGPFNSKPAPATDPATDPLRHANPHPLDLPSDEQGAALAALDSGRWTVEPGTNMLADRAGGGRKPTNALGLVRELQARDWIATDGTVTLTGRHALTRWLDSSD
jgi:hypothetical protein